MIYNYSNIILTDDNFDENLEMICDTMGVSQECYESFESTLDDSFTFQYNNNIKEWISSNGCISSKCGLKATQSYKIAYEFANGFMVFNCNDVI